VAAEATEAAPRLVQPGGDPADEHVAVAPAHVAAEAADEAVEVLDRIGAAQRTVERAGDAEALQRERLVQPFAQQGGRAGVRSLESLEIAQWRYAREFSRRCAQQRKTDRQSVQTFGIAAPRHICVSQHRPNRNAGAGIRTRTGLGPEEF